MTRNSQRFNPRSPGTDRQSVVVLGIDPGTLTTGYGIVARTVAAVKLLECGTIKNDSALPLPARLHHIYTGLSSLIESFRPDEIAIESAFYGKNVQSALKLGHARGVALLAAVEQNIPTGEYTPREVKKAVVGRGSATKEQVQFMVKSILHLRDMRMALDTSDALAIALCHLQRMQMPSPRHRDWKAYLSAHPERIRQ
jgi:crossover junction endodeoxyribonuclease RuvC